MSINGNRTIKMVINLIKAKSECMYCTLYIQSMLTCLTFRSTTSNCQNSNTKKNSNYQIKNTKVSINAKTLWIWLVYLIPDIANYVGRVYYRKENFGNRSFLGFRFSHSVIYRWNMCIYSGWKCDKKQTKNWINIVR